MAGWRKLKPLGHPGWSGCYNCAPEPEVMPLDAELHDRIYGWVTVKRGKDIVWSDDSNDPASHPLSEFEAKAAADPEHDWRLVLWGPLSGQEYQRQDGAWVLVKTDQGFA